MTSAAVSRVTGEAWQRTSRLASAAAGAAVRRRRVVLAALVAGQWAVIAAEALGSITHNGWVYYHGGDAPWYWTSAYTIAHGNVPQSFVGYGWPLLLAPFAAAFGPDMANGLPAVIVLDVVVLAPVAVVGMYVLGRRIGGALFGLWTALVWVAATPLAVHLYNPGNRPTLVDNFLPTGLGLNALSDYPSMVCAIVAACLVVRAVDRDAWVDGVLAGIAVGMLVMIKPSNGPFAIVAGLVLAVARRRRSLAAAAAGVVPGLLALTLWKATGRGNVPLFAQGASSREASGAIASVPGVHRYLNLDWHHLWRNLGLLGEVFWSVRVLEFLFVAGIAALVARSRPKGVFVALWFVSFGIVKGTFFGANVEDASLYRFLQPAWPAWILIVAGVVLLWPVGPERRARAAAADADRARTVRPVRTGVAVAAAILFGAVPLAVAAGLRPIARGSVADDVQHGAIVPVVDFGLRAQALGGGSVRLTWTRRGSGRAAELYRVFRGPTDGCSFPAGGAPQCDFVDGSPGTTSARSFTDEHVRGRVVYRVGLQAVWNRDPTARDLVLLSEPVVVDAS